MVHTIIIRQGWQSGGRMGGGGGGAGTKFDQSFMITISLMEENKYEQNM